MKKLLGIVVLGLIILGTYIFFRTPILERCADLEYIESYWWISNERKRPLSINKDAWKELLKFNVNKMNIKEKLNNWRYEDQFEKCEEDQKTFPKKFGIKYN